MPEPVNFRKLDLPPGATSGRFFATARPGRSLGADALVTDEVVQEWVEGVAVRLVEAAALPADRRITYICLLGWKPSEGGRPRRREIADYYAARQPADGDDTATLAKPTFEDYLNGLAGGRLWFTVKHVPTVDHEPVFQADREVAIRAACSALKRGGTVLVGCSYAQGRTGEIFG
jgi:hypothetical protein